MDTPRHESRMGVYFENHGVNTTFFKRWRSATMVVLGEYDGDIGDDIADAAVACGVGCA